MIKASRGLLLAIALPVWAAGLDQGERDYALSQLHATRKMLLDSIAGLSDAQWKFKPAPGRWSIAEAAEHLILTEDSLFNQVRKTVAGPAVPVQKADRAEDEKLYSQIASRDQKAQAPAEVRPAGKFKTPAAAARDFKRVRDRTLEYVRTTQDDLRSHVANVGPGREDAYQLLILIAAHTERHVKQIDEVKRDPKYPK